MSHRWALRHSARESQLRGLAGQTGCAEQGRSLPRPHGPVQDMGWGGTWGDAEERLGALTPVVALTFGLLLSCGVWGCWHPWVPALAPIVLSLFIHIHPHSSRFSPHLREKKELLFLLNLGLPWWVQRSGSCFHCQGPSSLLVRS